MFLKRRVETELSNNGKSTRRKNDMRKELESKVSLPLFSLPRVPLAFAPSRFPLPFRACSGWPFPSALFWLRDFPFEGRASSELKVYTGCGIPKITIGILAGLKNPIGDPQARLSRVC